jgi:WD40 repeat protein
LIEFDVMAFSPDGSRLAVAFADTVRLFDMATGLPVLVLRGHACGVGGLAFSDDGSRLASSACDGIRIWALDLDDLLEIARSNVTRSLTDAECRRYLHAETCSAG